MAVAGHRKLINGIEWEFLTFTVDPNVDYLCELYGLYGLYNMWFVHYVNYICGLYMWILYVDDIWFI